MLNFGYRSIGHLVTHKAAINGQRPLVLFEEQTITYAEFSALTNRAARAFTDMGVKIGDRVGILLWNDPWALVAWVGLARIGAWAAFINPHYRGESLDHLISSLEPDALIVAENVIGNVRETPSGARSESVILHGDQSSDLVSMTMASDSDEQDSVHNPAEIAGLIHTSGTTGNPKFCLLSHNYYISAGMVRMRQLQPEPVDRFYICMPIYHAHKHFMNPLIADASLALSPRFSVNKFWDEVRAHEATILLMHDQPMVMLLNQPPHPRDLDHPAKVVHPGFRRQREFHERFGVDVVSGIGTNESQVIAMAPRYRSHADLTYYHTESPGMEILHDMFEVNIVDDDGAPVAVGVPGEIISRQKHPHTMFEGYFRDEQATARAIRDGWFHHGDLGKLDERGMLHFVGRKADSIRHRGEWIPQEMVENKVNSHPDVAGSAVIGVASGLGDEDLKLFVVRKNPDLRPEAVLDHVSSQVPYFMVPRYVEFIEELPRTPGLEKVRRHELSKSLESVWDREAAGYTVRKGR